MALRNPPRYKWLMGLMYAGLFYMSLPVLIWRYGKYPSLLLLTIPIGINIGISQVLSYAFALNYMITGIFLSLFIRAFVALYVVANDMTYRNKALIARGWQLVGSCEVTSRKNAMEFFQDSQKVSGPDNIEVHNRWISILMGLKACLPKFSKTPN